MGQMYAQKMTNGKFLGRMLGNIRNTLGTVLQIILATFESLQFN